MPDDRAAPPGAAHDCRCIQPGAVPCWQLPRPRAPSVPVMTLLCSCVIKHQQLHLDRGRKQNKFKSESAKKALVVVFHDFNHTGPVRCALSTSRKRMGNAARTMCTFEHGNN